MCAREREKERDSHGTLVNQSAFKSTQDVQGRSQWEGVIDKKEEELFLFNRFELQTRPATIDSRPINRRHTNSPYNPKFYTDERSGTTSKNKEKKFISQKEEEEEEEEKEEEGNTERDGRTLW